VGCPYQGSAPGPSLLALNKAASKSVFRERGIATPEWELMTAPPEPGWRPLIDPPLFAKPNQGGSSLGMTLVKETGELEAIIRRILEAGDACLLEELVDGPEVTCAILGDRPLPLILIEPKDAPYFDYESKYVPGRTLETCPAPIGEQLAARIREASLEAHRTLGLAGYSRADFMVAGGEPLLLETNTLPGMTPTSLVPQAAEAAGYSFSELIAELIRLGLENRGGRA
jgi:D-alanine-D-alanine ligase